METSGIDLRSLRLGCPRSLPRSPGASSGTHIEDGSSVFPMSRRDALKAAGAAALTATPAAGALSALLGGADAVSVISTPRTVTLASGLGRRVTIDVRRFGGPAVITSTDLGEGRVEVKLSNARWPGTELPADMRIQIDTSPGGIALLELALGGLLAAVPAAEWLAGTKIAAGRVHLGRTVCSLGDSSAIRLSGSAIASLSPDLTLHLTGRRLASADVFGERLYADSCSVRMLDGTEPSYIKRRLKRRSTITLERGGNEWRIEPRTLAPGWGTLDWNGKGFETLTIETAESTLGRAYRVLVADAVAGPAATIRLGPKAGLAGKVSLSGVRVASAFESAGDGVALVADATDARWLRGNGVSYLVGADGAGSTFEAAGRAGRARPSWTPRVQAIAAPLPDNSTGGLAGPLRFPQDTEVLLDLGGRIDRSVKAQAAGGGGIPIAPIIIDLPPTGVILPGGTVLEYVRPSDMLHIRFRFYNLSVVPGDAGKRLVRTNKSEPSYLVAEFQPQSILEQAFPLGTAPSYGPPVRSLISGESQLAFKIPDAKADAGIDYALSSLLDWGAYTPSLQEHAKVSPSVAVGVGGLAPSDPRLGGKTTYIEQPYRMFMSPNEYGRWHHYVDPHTEGDWTALWHTRLREFRFSSLFGALGQGDVKSAAAAPTYPPITPVVPIPPTGMFAREITPTMRAIWSPDYPNAGAVQFTPVQAMKPVDRRDLVALMAYWREAAAEAPLVMLTSLGGWLTLGGRWMRDNPSLEQWQHRATLGRDHYVRIVRGGYLYPFGHRAIKVEVTERLFATGPSTGRKTAFLFKRTFIVVLERERSYSYPGKSRERMNPFRKLRVITRQTPNLDLPQAFVAGVPLPSPIGPWPAWSADEAFFPKVGGKDFLFDVEAEDWEGRTITFGTPAVWIDKAYEAGYEGPTDPTPSYDVSRRRHLSLRQYYVGAAKSAAMENQKVAFASAGTKPNSTTAEVEKMYFTAEVPDSTDWNAIGSGPHFFLLMHHAGVRMTEVSQLAGTDAATDVEYYPSFVNSGFGAGEIFLQTTADLNVGVSGQNSGGLAAPAVPVRGISRRFGPVGAAGAVTASSVHDDAVRQASLPVRASSVPGLDTFNGGTFDPKQYFGDVLDATLLGSVKLADVLLNQALGASDSALAPKFSSRVEGNDIVVSLEWRYGWNKNGSLGPFKYYNGTTKLDLKAEIRTPKPGASGQTIARTTGELAKFDIVFLPGDSDPWITVKFDKITFGVQTGQSATVEPLISTIQFGGALKFIAELTKYLGFGDTGGSDVKAAGLSGGLAIDISGSGISVKLSLALPSIGVGLFSLSNIVLGARVLIPFTSSPFELGFNVSSREKPFMLAISFFGGMGFVDLVLTPDQDQKIKSLQIQFEFGCMLSLDVGVASGSVSITAGIYYKQEGAAVTFEAFIKIAGELSILGLIEVSLTIMLILQYQNKAVSGREMLVGIATCEVSVEILFLSFSVSFEVRRELDGSDPKVIEMIPTQSVWDEYCDAYASLPGAGG